MTREEDVTKSSNKVGVSDIAIQHPGARAASEKMSRDGHDRHAQCQRQQCLIENDLVSHTQGRM